MEKKETKEMNRLPYSMIVLVRKDLSMKPGKVAAQCIHAITGAYNQTLDSKITQLFMKSDFERRVLCLKIANEEEMIKMKASLDELKINNFIQVDLGFTQVPAMTKTVMAIGPVYTNGCTNISHLIQNLSLY